MVSGVTGVQTGARRLVGRPRDTSLDELILRTVRDLLVERGYEALSIQEVSRRSGVHALTIRRRWETKGALVTAAIMRDDDPQMESSNRVAALPTGHLRDDLKRMVTEMNAFLADPAVRAALPILWGQSTADPAVSARLSYQREQWFALIQRVLELAVLSGDAPPGALDNTQILVDVLSGTAFVRQGVEERRSSESDVDALIDVLLTGLLRNAPPEN
jgi:AcrR family transcriptional regulator